MNINDQSAVRMKLYVIAEKNESFDILIGAKDNNCDFMTVFAFSYKTGILKYSIQKRLLDNKLLQGVKLYITLIM